MKKIMRVVMAVIFAVSLCACGTTEEEATYKTVSMCGIEMEVPATYTRGYEGEGYMEFMAEETADSVIWCYTEGEDYETVRNETIDSLKEATKYENSFRNESDSEFEVNGIKGCRIEYTEYNYSSVLLLIPLEDGVLSISAYIEDDEILEHVLGSMKPAEQL